MPAILAKKLGMTQRFLEDGRVERVTVLEAGPCPVTAIRTQDIDGYRPQFYFRTTDVTGVVELQEGVEMVMPGDNAEMTVELIQPIAMDEGLRFAIREGGRTVGAGAVTKIIQ